MEIDVIMLANSKNAHLVQLTQSAIDTCHESETDITFNIVVLEQAGVKYDKATAIDMKEPFNYNRYMNYGLSKTYNRYVALCNNDLIFHEGWASEIINAMQSASLLSASPMCPKYNVGAYEPKYRCNTGYRIRHELNGWCIVVKREIFRHIGELNEDYPFWFADNVYAEQLKKHKIRHGLVEASKVTHLGSSTLHTLPPATQGTYTTHEIKRFCTEYPENETAIFFKSKGY